MSAYLPDDLTWVAPHAPWNDEDPVEPDLDDIDYDARRERALLIGEDE